MSGLLQKYSIAELLGASGSLQEKLWKEAGELRDSIFGKEVFIRGVVEISNYCRQNCDYCGMRRDNQDLDRYRLDGDSVFEHLKNYLPPEVRDINFQTGEDVVSVRDRMVPLIQRVRQGTQLRVSLCLGTLSPKEYDTLRDAGAEYYIIKIESGNEAHFQAIHAPGTLQKRIEAIRYLSQSGWSVSSGFISGLPGQTTDHMVETLNLLQSLPLKGTSVSPFIPGENTPFAGFTTMTGVEALNSVAILRLQNPERVIPAVSAFNIVHEEGYRFALNAGANLATINLTPERERADYQLYTQKRVIMNRDRVLRALEGAGLTPSDRSMITSIAPVAVH
ncbi:MAG: radical SAM protein [Verrucomicrobiota bacterium]